MNTTLKLVTKNRQKKVLDLRTGKTGVIKFQENRGSVFVRYVPGTSTFYVGWTLCFKGNGRLHGDKFNYEQAKNLATGRSYDTDNRRLVLKAPDFENTSAVSRMMREAKIPDTLIPEILEAVEKYKLDTNLTVSIFTKVPIK
jgi:hypothetical protein